MGTIDGSVTPGTVIATFTDNNGTRFLSGTDHTAIFKGPTTNGFEVWDQNWTQRVFGKHFIYASGSGTSNANNYYVVQINNPAYLGSTIKYGQEVTGSIAKSGDYQDWKFTGQAGDIITIHMVEDGGASLYPQVYLLDPSGSSVKEGDGSAEAWIKNYTLGFSGIYTLRAEGYYSTGGYKLSLALKPPAGSIVYGQEVKGQIDFQDDYQDWKFTGQAGDIITIHMVEDGGASLYPQVYLLDPSGSSAKEGDGSAEAWIKNYTLGFSGIYTLRAEGYYSTGGYRLSLKSNSGLSSPSPATTDEQLIALAQQAALGKPQPEDKENYGSCLIYAQRRGLGVTAKGNTGAFNILYQGNDAKLVNNVPTAPLKSGIKPLQNIGDLTVVLQPGDFIVWQRNVAGANATYGHIAVVELVEAGRVVISEAGWGDKYWRVLYTSYFDVGGMYGYPLGLH
jgi:hypothetical protein